MFVINVIFIKNNSAIDNLERGQIWNLATD